MEAPRPADSLLRHWTERLPAPLQALARLSRYDRPVGWQLLWLPCAMGLALVSIGSGFSPSTAQLAALFLIGAIAMRGAGCTWNDILDRNIDAQVARTRGRPIPAGAIGVKGALAWMIAQCGVGFLVLLALPRAAQIVALIALPLVALYPLMKRITWWPQAWLGMVFSWGVLVAGASVQAPTDPTWRGGVAPLHLTVEVLIFYLGCVSWTIAYDTIYALQDKEDDALVGVRSTARLFGDKWRDGVTIFYLVALLMWSVAAFMAGAKPLFIGVLIFTAMLLIRADLQKIDPTDGASALKAFKANVRLGLGVIVILALAGLWNQFLKTPFAP